MTFKPRWWVSPDFHRGKPHPTILPYLNLRWAGNFNLWCSLIVNNETGYDYGLSLIVFLRGLRELAPVVIPDEESQLLIWIRLADIQECRLTSAVGRIGGAHYFANYGDALADMLPGFR